MKYPKKSHYLRFRKKNRSQYYILDYKSGDTWTADSSLVRFLRSLDGWSDPYLNAQGMTGEEVTDTLEFLAEEGFLDDGVRFRAAGPGTATWTMIIAEDDRRTRSFARVWNRALLLLWLPLLVCGLSVLVQGGFPYIEQEWGIFRGFVNGMALGLSLHELSHAYACLSYGGDWVEAGVAFVRFIPAAYVLLDADAVKGRFRRIQIAAAGPEANMALAGFFLILLKTGCFDSLMLLTAALLNFTGGILNLSLVEDLDGMKIFSELLGISELSSEAGRVLRDPGAVKKLKRRGINGKATLAGLKMIRAFQMIELYMILITIVRFISFFTG